ncbi:MAG: hypothetical protein ACRED9_12310 [Caulobacteraceae bacterium]
MAERPYISWLGHGAADLAPPGIFTDARANFFAFSASRPAMQSLADALLNPAGMGKVRYEVPLGLAVASFMDIARCTSASEIMGWLPGRECALFVPLIETHRGHPLKTRFVLWAPYIFISYTIGMVTGREVWGWPKVLAEISPADDLEGPGLSCATTYFPTLAAETRGVTGPLFTVRRTAAGPAAPVWRDGLEAAEGLIGALLGGIAGALVDAVKLKPQAPSVALKQFRQAGMASQACYQAICDSPIEITAFKGGGPRFDSFELEVATCESHPIVRDLLGRDPDPVSTKLPVVFAAWTVIDFQALSGADVIVAA